MLALIRKIVSLKFFPLAWTLMIIVLLCLPGSYVPGDGIFGIEHLDKVVHIVLFGGLVVFWGWHYEQRTRPAQPRKLFAWIAMLSLLLGILMEFVQMYFVPNRSFDGWDILADAAGALLGWFWLIKLDPRQS